MSVDRRTFIQGVMGAGLIAVALAPNISLNPSLETIETRIRRLFMRSTVEFSIMERPTVSPLINNQFLTFSKNNNKLLKLSDEDFIKEIENNIRLDFSEGNIIDMAGWQLSTTEVSVMNIIGTGHGK